LQPRRTELAVYLVTSVEVLDQDKYRPYTVAGHAAVIRHGGRFLAEGAAPTAVEGTWLPKRMAIVEFPSVEAALAFYHSAEYTAARELRKDVARFNMILVPGTG
jgi:uncharacterized protein (DUF1330 family)